MSSFILKIIALTSMIIDHTGSAFSMVYKTTAMRFVGRLAFPIYAFLIAEGAKRTKSMEKYLMRLLVFGLISEIPFNFLFKNVENIRFGLPLRYIALGFHNVFFTLFAGALCIYFFQKLEILLSGKKALIRLITFSAALCISFLAKLLEMDYGYNGVLIIYFIYLTKENDGDISMSILTALLAVFSYFAGVGIDNLTLNNVYIAVIFLMPYIAADYAPPIIKTRVQIVIIMAFFLNSVYNHLFNVSIYYYWALAGVALTCFYSGKEGKKAGLAFYAAYPAHIIILSVVFYFWVYPAIGISIL